MTPSSTFSGDAPGTRTSHRVASVFYVVLGLAFGLSTPWVLASSPTSATCR